MNDHLPPIEIEVTRGEMVESRHLADAIVVDAQGKALRTWGEVDHPVYARSAIKPFQALPLVETGAAEAYGLSQRQLALACASHNGEPAHVDAVNAWLKQLGLNGEHLECGCHLPSHQPSAHAMLRANQDPTNPHNNCSGKHTGMLTHAVHQGEDPKGYIQIDHPVQLRVREALESLTGQDLSSVPKGIDGCGLPQFGIPLRSLALGMARMADPSDLPAARREAIGVIKAAMAAEPFYIAGTGRFCTDVMQSSAGKSLVKTGAEGVYCGMIPHAGLGLAIKLRDGAGRGRDMAFAHLLRLFGGLDEAAWEKLTTHVRPQLHNHAGTFVGEVRMAAGWDAV